MGFFVADAQAAGAAGAPGMGDLIFLVLLFVVFYFILIRPQMKRNKEHRNLVSGLAKGDEVVTSGGLLGRITKVGDTFVMLEIADGLEVKVRKQSVETPMQKGTLKKVL